jgi:hypothetical protein
MRFSTIVVLLTLALGGCTSPEATRTRGGGAGADVGNRRVARDAESPGPVSMHEGSDPFWKTPVRSSVAHPALAPSRQADALSRGRR